MKLANQSVIKEFAKDKNVPEWVVHKAIYELNTNDTKVLNSYFDQQKINIKLDELLSRSEEISLLLQQSRTISTMEWEPINIRVSHLKEDLKNIKIDFAYIHPNLVGQLRDYINEKSTALLERQLSQQSFLVELDILLDNVSKFKIND